VPLQNHSTSKKGGVPKQRKKNESWQENGEGAHGARGKKKREDLARFAKPILRSVAGEDQSLLKNKEKTEGPLQEVRKKISRTVARGSWLLRTNRRKKRG